LSENEESTMQQQQQQTTDAGGTGGVCLLAWKKRGGGALSELWNYYATASAWEQRWVTILTTTTGGSSSNGGAPSSSTVLSYYSVGEEDGVPRGVVDLDAASNVTVTPVLGRRGDRTAPTTHQVDLFFVYQPPAVPAQQPAMAPPTGGPEAAVAAAGGDKPTTGASGALATTTIGSSSSNNNNAKKNHDSSNNHHGKATTWTFCFDTQQDLMQFLTTVHNALDRKGQFAQKDTDRFEHDFKVADHIYRWEMIFCPPVIYPIQIHGIVITAGRNCLVVADFGRLLIDLFCTAIYCTRL
jgi:hypothetical protein